MTIDGQQLLTAIAQNKDVNKEAAKDAFAMFCGYYEEDATKMAIVLCRSWKRSDDYAYAIVQCAFEKVWKYPTFDKSKTNYKNTDKAILQWINKILLRELILFSDKGNCSHVDPEDLPLITNSAEFIQEYYAEEYVSEEDSERMRAELDRLFEGLSEQEVTIFLTYKLYEGPGKRVPRSVLKKLRSRYNITQDGIKHCRLRVQQKIGGLLS